VGDLFGVLLIPFTVFLSLLLLLIKEHDGSYVVDLTLTDGRMCFGHNVHVGSYERYLDLARLAAWAQGFAGARATHHAEPPARRAAAAAYAAMEAVGVVPWHRGRDRPAVLGVDGPFR
jgi:hypothetical protein